jgi:hypothetical protein
VLAATEVNTNEPIKTFLSYIEAFSKADEESRQAQFGTRNLWPRSKKFTDERIVLTEQSLHNELRGTSAYVVVPVSFTDRMNSKLVRQVAYSTVALTQASCVWRIASWAWTKGVRDGTPAF